MNFEQLVTIITDTHQQLQQSAVKAVNQCQTVRNWLIGFYIVEFEQNGEDRAQYGEQLLKKLEQRINQNGLNDTLFKWSRKFYLVYPSFASLINNLATSISATMSHQSRNNDLMQISATVSHLLQNSDYKQENSISPEKLISSISFSHFIELMKIDLSLIHI